MNPVFGTGSIFKFAFRGGALSYVQMIPWNTGMENAKRKKNGLGNDEGSTSFPADSYNEPLRDARKVDQYTLMKDPAEMKKGVFHWLSTRATSPTSRRSCLTACIRT